MAHSLSFPTRLRGLWLLSLTSQVVWLVGGVATDAGAMPAASLQHPVVDEMPPGIGDALRAACRQVTAAASLDAITAARDTLDRLSDRQQEAGCTWVVAVDDIAGATGDLLDTDHNPAPGVGLPLSGVLTRLRWRLAAAASVAMSEGDAPFAVPPAGAATHGPEHGPDAPSPQLLDAASGIAIVRRELAAGDRAIERGWPAAATAAWQDALTLAQWMHAPQLADLATARLATLPTTGPPHLPSLRRGHRLWQHRLPAGNRQAASEDGSPHKIRLAVSAADGSDAVVCWHADGGVHARRLDDGGVPWGEPASFSDRLFPPSGDAPFTMPSWPPCLADGRLLSVVTPSNGHSDRSTALSPSPVLVCLDLTAATQGRLEWSTPLPASVADWVGPPVCGRGEHGEGLAFLCVGGTTNQLIAVRLADGQLLWRRTLSLGAPRQGPQASVPLTPVVAEDRVVVAAGDGSVWAVDLAGELAWVQASFPAAVSEQAAGEQGPEWRRGSLPAVVAGGTLVVANKEALTLTAVDLHTGQPQWQFTVASAPTLLGTTRGAVVAWQDTEIISLSAHDGSVRASRAITAGPQGEPILAHDQLLWPQRSVTADGAAVLLLDPVTLEACGEPIPIDSDSTSHLAIAADRLRMVVWDGEWIRAFGPSGIE